MFLDVRKAFDTVDHHLLLSKLAKEGVGGVVLRWFYSYLSGRRQFVKVGGESSLSTPVVRSRVSATFFFAPVRTVFSRVFATFFDPRCFRGYPRTARYAGSRGKANE